MSKSPKKLVNSLPSLRYEVLHYPDLGVLVIGDGLPSGDLSALAKHFSFLGLNLISTKIPTQMGLKGVAFVRSYSAEEDWLNLLAQTTSEESHHHDG